MPEPCHADASVVAATHSLESHLVSPAGAAVRDDSSHQAMRRDHALAACRGVQALRDAADCAKALEADRWQTAVERRSLHSLSLVDNDLRWLIGRGLVEQAEEITQNCDFRRRFVAINSLALTRRSCFILTAKGYTWASESKDKAMDPSIPVASADCSRPPTPADDKGRVNGSTPINRQPVQRRLLPRWNGELHELWFEDRLIKRFTRRAPCQEAILAAFTEEGWPEAIFDPLHPQSDQDPTRRLHRAVGKLNHAQEPQLIRFFVNGGGVSIHWTAICEEIAQSDE